MRHAKRVDGNQSETIEKLRARKYEVKITSHIGHGFPDFIVRRGRKAIAVELKNKGKIKQLTIAEIEMRDWLVSCGLRYVVAENIEEIERNL